MLETISNFICSLIMCSTGFIIIRNLIKKEEKLFSLRNSSVILLQTIIQLLIHTSVYTIEGTLLTFLVNLIIYKYIFKVTIEEIMICCGIYAIILFFSDAIVTIVIRGFFTVSQIRTNAILSIIANIVIGILGIIISNFKFIKTKSTQYINIVKEKSKILSIIFILLIVVCFILLGYNATTSSIYDIKYLISIIIMIYLTIIAFLFVKQKINYHQLNDEYDTLFGYIQNFEEWIEKEQLNRHEYKNQIAILRSLTKEKALIKKIDEMLEDNINIKNEEVYKLKELPKGGIKGLMYYKVAIAQKYNLKVDVDVSVKKDKILNKLTEDEQKSLCKLIGIYFDNAIEAAVETKKKLIVLEIYNIKSSTKIIISNSFNNDNIENRNEKGFTTKGKGRGNGLYYAKNILSKNSWIESKQEIIDDLYVQTLEIKKD